MKDIVLKITGKTLNTIPKPPEGFEEDPVEFVTMGRLSTRGNITFISYEETDLSGIPGCKSTLTITPNKVKLKRSGEDRATDTIMEFEKGKRHYGTYDTPFGPIDMEILADNISAFAPCGENRNKMSIEYAISLHGLMESRKSIDIEVLEKN